MYESEVIFDFSHKRHCSANGNGNIRTKYFSIEFKSVLGLKVSSFSLKNCSNVENSDSNE